MNEGSTVLTLRPLARADIGLLAGWLAEAHVEPWWREPTNPAEVEAKYRPGIDGDDLCEYFVVEQDGEPVGFMQRYRLSDEPAWQQSLRVCGTPDDAAGIDYLIGDASRIGRGLGPRMIEQFVADTWKRYPEVPAIVVDVDQDNRRSWRALEKAGFRRVWSGELESDDPADEGPCHVYLLARPCR